MDYAWAILEAAGMPDGAIRPRPTKLPPDVDLRLALAWAEEHSGELPEARRDPLRAWLRAFAHHWPARFADLFGDAGERFVAQLMAEPMDANRYLKLRRIAIENLSAVV